MYKRLLYTLFAVLTLTCFVACGGNTTEDKDDKSSKTEVSDKDTDDDDDDDDEKDGDLSSLFDKLSGGKKEDKTSEDDKDIASGKDSEDDKDIDSGKDSEDGKDVDSGKDSEDDKDVDSGKDSEDDKTPEIGYQSSADVDFKGKGFYGLEPSVASAITMPDGVFAENDACSMAIISTDTTDDAFSYTIQIENKLSYEMSFNISQTYVNDLYLIPYWDYDLPGGETYTETFTIERSELEALGMSEVTKLTFWFDIYDTEEWDTHAYGISNYHPMGLSRATTYDYKIEGNDTVLIDENGVVLVITDFETTDSGDFIAHIYCENNTTANYGFQLEHASLNGLACSSYTYFNLPAGMRTYASLGFASYSLEDAKIVLPVNTLEFSVDIIDLGPYDTAFDGTFTVYPLGKEASDTFTFSPADTDIVLFENDSCKMIVTGTEMDRSFYADIYMENTSDTELRFYSSSSRVNGVEFSPFLSTTLAPGQKAYTTVTWYSFYLEDEGITSVDSVELDIEVYDNEEWETILEDTFSFEP